MRKQKTTKPTSNAVKSRKFRESKKGKATLDAYHASHPATLIRVERATLAAFGKLAQEHGMTTPEVLRYFVAKCVEAGTVAEAVAL